ncbi:MAG TPA: cobalamin-dependent protein [Candidatus Eisenbacteria bacterium]|nr:cobalamin-dependent protein [Candidatus Eisenbacteria bacterium]
MERGHRPGEILGLSAKELKALARLTASRPSTPAPRGADGTQVRGPELLFEAVADFDRVRLIGELRRQWAHMGPIPFLDEIAGPFMADVGVAWQSGKLEVRHEHFAAACLSDFLREVREPFERRATGPRVVASTLSGDRHEAGLLAVSVILAMRGYRVAYLGADTPIDQIAAAVSHDMAAVAVSISSVVPRSRAAKAVALLRDALPRRVPLWIGGAGAPTPIAGVERFESLAALDARL